MIFYGNLRKSNTRNRLNTFFIYYYFSFLLGLEILFAHFVPVHPSSDKSIQFIYISNQGQILRFVFKGLSKKKFAEKKYAH
jgi:hypothetical protein